VGKQPVAHKHLEDRDNLVVGDSLEVCSQLGGSPVVVLVEGILVEVSTRLVVAGDSPVLPVEDIQVLLEGAVEDSPVEVLVDIPAVVVLVEDIPAVVVLVEDSPAVVVLVEGTLEQDNCLVCLEAVLVEDIQVVVVPHKGEEHHCPVGEGSRVVVEGEM